MYDPLSYPRPRSSFVEPVRTPAGSPLDPPTVCVELAAAWLPYVVGALTQLCLPTTWITTNDAALIDILSRVQDLIDAVGTAGACMQAGQHVVTIAAGGAVGAYSVVFVQPFAVAPVVVVSESSGLYIASMRNVTVDGCDLVATANVDQRADATTTVSYIARVAS